MMLRLSKRFLICTLIVLAMLHFRHHMLSAEGFSKRPMGVDLWSSLGSPLTGAKRDYPCRKQGYPDFQEPFLFHISEVDNAR